MRSDALRYRATSPMAGASARGFVPTGGRNSPSEPDEAMSSTGVGSLRRDFHRDTRPPGRRTLDLNLALVRFNQALCGRQSQSRAAGLRGEERRKNLVPDLRRDSWACVGECNLACAVPRLDRDIDPALALHGVRAVH